MKRCLILTAVDPTIGGVLVLGDRGTGKSTIVRSLASLLPKIRAVEKTVPIIALEKIILVNTVKMKRQTALLIR